MEPNPLLLDNALRQTQKETLNTEPWRRYVLDKLATIKQQRMIDDIRPCLERAEDLSLMKRAHLERLLRDGSTSG